jgi:hypothetical protein
MQCRWTLRERVKLQKLWRSIAVRQQLIDRFRRVGFETGDFRMESVAGTCVPGALPLDSQLDPDS